MLSSRFSRLARWAKTPATLTQTAAFLLLPALVATAAWLPPQTRHALTAHLPAITLPNLTRQAATSNDSPRARLIQTSAQANSSAAPVINSVSDNVVTGSLHAAPNSTFRLDFFASPDASGEQNQSFLGSANATTNGSGDATFRFVSPTDLDGQFVSATATAQNGAASAPSSAVSAPITSCSTVVTTNADAGAGSLRAAIDCANTDSDANVITFAAGVSGSITLNSALANLSTPMTISGPGASALTVKRNAASAAQFRIFTVSNGTTVSVSGLTLSGGQVTGNQIEANYGGAIFNDHGKLSVANCIFSGNSAIFGGAIYSYGSNNTVSGNAGTGGATLTVTGSTFSGNSAVAYAGNNGGGGDGGAIYSDGGSFDNTTSGGKATATISDSTFSNNTAAEYAGALYAYGETNGNVTTNLTRCTFSGNSAVIGGGAVYNDGEAGVATLSVVNSTLSNNTSPGASNATSGGAIYNDGNFNGNALLSISGSTLVGNNARLGGAVYNEGGGSAATLAISNSTFSGNRAQFYGGAVYNYGSERSSNKTKASFDSVTLADNFTESSSIVASGGIYAFGYDASVTLKNNIFLLGMSGQNLDSSRNGVIVSQGNNLSSDFGSGILTASTDKVSTNPKLGPLANNGGPTQTHALLAGSPAIDAGNTTLTTDQRGVARPQGADDVGAYESAAAAPAKTNTTTTLASTRNPSTTGQPVSIIVTVRPTSGSGRAGGTVTLKDGATTVFTSPLAVDTMGNGATAYNTSNLAPGTHSFTATYSGDANYNGSTSAVLRQVVNAASACSTVVTTNADGGNGSLRAAIGCANSDPDASTISFNIAGAGVKTIALDSALPNITTRVVINGYSQPNSSANTNAMGAINAVPLIQIVGNGGTGTNLKLVAGSGGSSVRGLILSGAGDSGIELGSPDNVVGGCFIGTNAAGLVAQGNSFSGVRVTDFSNDPGDAAPTGNSIGGTSAADRNLIAGNGTTAAVSVQASAATGTKITGNLIGLDKTGAMALGNRGDGVGLASNDNVVGNNVIAGNLVGVRIAPADTAADVTGNVVQNNLIGLNAAGTAAIPNRSAGVRLETASDIAGARVNGSAGARANDIGGNTISGNAAGGIVIVGAQTIANRILSNRIGVAANGAAPIPNTGGAGVELDRGANGNRIGGEARADANIIANNVERGVLVTSQAGTGNAILGNSIYNNVNLGIDLNTDGISRNDAGDADGGANNTQNFPVLNPISGQTISGTLNSVANANFRIEFFASPAADPTGYGEGQTFLGFQNVTTNASGNAPISFTAPSALSGQFIAATATRIAAGVFTDTSEFSLAVKATATNACSTVVTNTADAGAGSLRAAIACANSNPDASTITFAPNVSGTINVTATDDPDSTSSDSASAFLLTTPITIQGPGARVLTLQNNAANAGRRRVLRVAPGVAASISGLTFSGGNGEGMIFNSGTLSLNNCAFTDGKAAFTGGVLNSTLNNSNGGPSPALAINGCFFSGNSGRGGAAVANNVGTVSLSNSTFSGNTSESGGAVRNSGTMTLTNDTFAGNRTNLRSSGGQDVTNTAIAINAATPRLTVSNTIFGSAVTGGKTIFNGSGTVTDGGYNLARDDGGGVLTASTDKINTDARLGPLQNNGGSTQTFALLAGSPAIDAGQTALTTDQRGIARPQGAADDIGAYELQTVAPTKINTTTTLTSSPNPSTVGQNVTFTATVNAASAAATPTGTVTFKDGATTIGTANLVNGMASFATSTLAPGTRQITATYGGSANFNASTAATLTQTVSAAPVLPQLSIGDVSAPEGNSSAKPFAFIVTLTPVSTKTVTVRYATANGAATVGSDYSSNAGTLTFAPGVTTQTIPVSVIGDTTREADETFTVNLSAPTNATISKATGIGTIQNDDFIADLSVTQSATPTSVPRGAQVTFNIVVTNNGPDAANNVTLTDALPAGATLISSAPAATQNGATLTYALGTIANGASVTVAIRVQTPNTIGTLTNSASATQSGATDATPANNSATATATTTNGAPAFAFKIGKLVNVGPYSPSLYRAGARFAQDVTVTNTGTAPANAPLQLALDGLPASVKLTNAGGVAAVTGAPFINLPNSLAVGQRVTVRLQFQLSRSDKPSFTPRIQNGELTQR